MNTKKKFFSERIRAYKTDEIVTSNEQSINNGFNYYRKHFCNVGGK